jgi:hypothetical protein
MEAETFNFPRNGVLGNYDPPQIELADNPTLRAVRRQGFNADEKGLHDDDQKV